MRRDGLLTGYLWNRNSWGKVKVKSKPTNASKASGRCTHAKCRSCHERPVSKSKAKTKGRNKRALSKLLVDDDWAFCKHSSSARHTDAVLAVSCCGAYLNDADETACEVHDAAAANLMGRDTTNDDFGANDASDKENVYGDIISDVHAHNRVEDVPVQVFAPDGSLRTVMMRFRVVLSDCIANPRVAAINDNGSDIIHECHAIKLQAEDAVALVHDGSIANRAALAHAAGDGSDDDSALDVSDPSAHTHVVHNAMIAMQISDLGCLNTAMGRITDINPGGFADARAVAINDDGSDVNRGGRAIAPHVKDAVFLKDDGINATHVKKLHEADAASNDDDDDHDFESLILPGLVNVDWPKINEREEVSDDINSEGDSLCGDWCHVACADALDDWYLC